jgi:hypothetical protein
MKQELITKYYKSNKKYRFLKQTKITDYYKTKVNLYEEIETWLCTQCGIDMGKCNPRQLCGKTFCFNIEYNFC